ncbi:hypothetical protein EDD11_008965 [Mortierella claussenii]|nr:hypothetical protein EDD11_008965 [Mortierella claussenii]
MSFEVLSKRDPSLSQTRRYLAFHDPHAPIHNENDLEDMMTDSAIAGTPPLDLESDSGDDDDDDDADDSEHAMKTPVSPLSFQPVSILQRKRKDSQEHPSTVYLHDRNQGQQELGHAGVPALASYGKGAQGRRPTVTFDLDLDTPSSSPPARFSARFTLETSQRSIHFRHDDDSEEDVENELDDDMVSQDAGSHPPTHDVSQAEKALRRVSISHVVEEITDNTTAAAPEPTLTYPQQEVPVKQNRDVSQEDILSQVLTGAAPQDMLVALFDRSSELQALAARHSEFFDLMYSSLPKTSLDDFKTLLFQPRDVLCDRDWMNALTRHLAPLPPCILEKFKGIVGWIGPDSDDEDENVLWGEDEYGYRDSSFDQVQIKWLRDIDDLTLENFQECYPQFFINARERLQGRRMSHGGDQRDQYMVFCETLGLSRKELACDNAWTRRMNGCLDKHPELMLQLKEIVAYESGYDD